MSFADRQRHARARVAAAEDRRRRQWRAIFVRGRRRLHFFEVPRARDQPEPDRLRVGRVDGAGKERELSDAELVRLPSGDGAGAAQRRGAISHSPQADKQHAKDTPLAARQVQRLVAAAAEVPARERATERAASGGIDRSQFVGECRRGCERDDEQRRLERADRWRAYGQLQRHGAMEGMVARRASLTRTFP